MKKHQTSSSPQINPEELYAKVNKPSRGQPPQRPEDTIYADLNMEASRRQQFQRPEDTIYADLNMDASRGRHPTQSIESAYATAGMSAHGGQNSQQLENSVYTALNTGGTITPPRTQKDEITSKLLKNVDFQYGVREVQEWSKVVYGNEHALNNQLAQILENPQAGEKIVWDLAESPESAGKLAGQKILGVKSPSRKEAEEGFISLCAALDRHVETAKKLHHDFTRDQIKQKGYERGENPERSAHKHHHHRAMEERHTSQQREVQPRGRHGEGMAFAM